MPDVSPAADGVVLTCQLCGRTKRFVVADVPRLVRFGMPRCCGFTMSAPRPSVSTDTPMPRPSPLAPPPGSGR